MRTSRGKCCLRSTTCTASRRCGRHQRRVARHTIASGADLAQRPAVRQLPVWRAQRGLTEGAPSRHARWRRVWSSPHVAPSRTRARSWWASAPPRFSSAAATTRTTACAVRHANARALSARTASQVLCPPPPRAGNFMAPEIVERNEYNDNADVWSLGCILFTMLHGYPPFMVSKEMERLYGAVTAPRAWGAFLLNPAPVQAKSSRGSRCWSASRRRASRTSSARVRALSAPRGERRRPHARASLPRRRKLLQPEHPHFARRARPAGQDAQLQPAPPHHAGRGA
jgi:hypothetical protein